MAGEEPALPPSERGSAGMGVNGVGGMAGADGEALGTAAASGAA
jgi:hypothetical protein